MSLTCYSGISLALYPEKHGKLMIIQRNAPESEFHACAEYPCGGNEAVSN